MIIEAKLISYLTNRTSVGGQVYAERPDNISGKYILIDKTGSDTTNMITTSTVAIQSIAPRLKGSSKLDAALLNEEVKAIMVDLIADGDIVMVDLMSDYDYSDISTNEYRYQAVYQITHY